MNLGDLIATEGCEPQEVETERLRAAAIRKAIEILPPRSRVVVVMRYGLDDGGERTLAVIGRTIGLGQSRVWQIVNESLVVLRGFLTGNSENGSSR